MSEEDKQLERLERAALAAQMAEVNKTLDKLLEVNIAVLTQMILQSRIAKEALRVGSGNPNIPNDKVDDEIKLAMELSKTFYDKIKKVARNPALIYVEG
jgi:hypothetical protein